MSLMNEFIANIKFDLEENEITLEDWFDSHDDIEDNYIMELWEEIGSPVVAQDSEAGKRFHEFLENGNSFDPQQLAFEAVRAYVESEL